jgi:hypothetical protein
VTDYSTTTTDELHDRQRWLANMIESQPPEKVRVAMVIEAREIAAEIERREVQS